jgi:hypothetical protein
MNISISHTFLHNYHPSQQNILFVDGVCYRNVPDVPDVLEEAFMNSIICLYKGVINF